MAHNDYDRILRENIQEIFVHYVEKLLGLEIAESKPLPSKITGTYEREVDHLLLATSRAGDQFLIHFEFQVSNDLSMLKRISHYHGMLFHKYGLPIHHFAIYLGQGKASMLTKLNDNEVFREFHLIELARQKLEDFLSAPNPEEVLLGIMSDFGSHTASEGVQRIIAALQVASRDEIQLKRYLQQLKILSRIRKLESVVHEIINIMPLGLDVRDSYDFKLGLKEGVEKGMERGVEQGIEKGIEQGKETGRFETVIQLAASGTITIEKAAEVLEVSIGEVNLHIQKMKEDLGS